MGKFKVSANPSELSAEGASSVNTAFSWLSSRPRPQISCPLDVRALCYFRANFVLGRSRSFRYLETFYRNDDMSDYLSLSIQCVGVAGLSKDMHSRELEVLARRFYSSALRSINKALSSPELATKDNTLSSVILLEHFERLLPSRQRTVQAWTNHLRGASALMNIRGPKQFKSKIGFDLFAHFTSYITITCIKYGIPLPTDYMEQRRIAAACFDTTQLSWCLSESAIRFVGFRVALNEGRIRTPEAILAFAKDNDDRLAWELSILPPRWTPELITLDPKKNSSLVYESYYDIYADYRFAECLNIIKTSRVILLDIIISCEDLQRKDHPSMNENKAFAEILPGAGLQPKLAFEKIASEICASVPQLAGYIPTISSPTPQSLPNKLPQSNLTAAYSLFVPLVVLGKSKHCPTGMREWIIEQVRNIAKAYDLEKALEALKILENSDERDDISVLEDFGTVPFLLNGVCLAT